MAIFASNMELASLFRDKLDCHVFQAGAEWRQQSSIGWNSLPQEWLCGFDVTRALNDTGVSIVKEKFEIEIAVFSEQSLQGICDKITPEK